MLAGRFLLVLVVIWGMCHITYQEPYKRINYHQLINMTQKAVQGNEDIFEYFEGYEHYPELLPPSDCNGEQIKFPVIRATNFKRKLDEINSLPQVFLIGPLHGDEIVGAHVLTYLLQRIAAEKHTRFWDILNSRMLIILPSSNAQGFCLNARESNSVDANRDFPYDVDPSVCMVSPSSRLVNEIVRSHLIVSSIVFHGGDNSLTYPWGNGRHQEKSPDYNAFKEIAENLRDLAGGVPEFNIQPYNIGTMTDVVYSVNGGLEDWIYSASWDTNAIPQCKPETQPAYPIEKTQYNSETNRVFIYLLEASIDKEPKEETFGEANNWDNKGHVSRDLLLTHKFIQLASPEVNVFSWKYDEAVKEGTVSYKPIGCITLDSLTLSYKLSKIENGKTFEQTFSIIISDCSLDAESCQSDIMLQDFSHIEMSFVIECDSNWKLDTNAETHMVKLRTNRDYYAKNREYFLNNKDGFRKSVEQFDANKNSLLFSTGRSSAAALSEGHEYNVLNLDSSLHVLFGQDIKSEQILLKRMAIKSITEGGLFSIATLELDWSDVLSVPTADIEYEVHLFDLINFNQDNRKLKLSLDRTKRTFSLNMANIYSVLGQVIEIRQIASRESKLLYRGIVGENKELHEGVSRQSGLLAAVLPSGLKRSADELNRDPIVCFLLEKDEKGSDQWLVSISINEAGPFSSGDDIELLELNLDRSKSNTEPIASLSLNETDFKIGVIRTEFNRQNIIVGEKYVLSRNGIKFGIIQVSSASSNHELIKKHLGFQYSRKHSEVEASGTIEEVEHSTLIFCFCFLVLITLAVMIMLFNNRMKDIDNQIEIIENRDESVELPQSTIQEKRESVEEEL